MSAVAGVMGVMGVTGFAVLCDVTVPFDAAVPSDARPAYRRVYANCDTPR